MNSGMYSAVSGNVAAMQRMDVITNNLANINTAGFKKDRMIFDSMLNSAKNMTVAAGTVTDAPVLSGYTIETDYSAGPLKQTGNPLDLSLDGDGFFVVDTPQGKAYTRQGNFHLDGKGQVVTSDGYAVQGNGGPVTIKGGRLEIDNKGGCLSMGRRWAPLPLLISPSLISCRKRGAPCSSRPDRKRPNSPPRTQMSGRGP